MEEYLSDFDDVDDDLELGGRLEPEHTDEKLLERRMQRRASRRHPTRRAFFPHFFFSSPLFLLF